MLKSPLPSLWIFPSEYRHLYQLDTPDGLINGNDPGDDQEEVHAGDGGDLIEVGVRDLGQRCLQLFGEEMSGPSIEEGHL